MNTKLTFTIDVEVFVRDPALDNPDSQIYGRTHDGSEYGIRYIMDQLQKRSWSATFFFNVYDTRRWGESRWRDIACEINARGFDVQLHTHVEMLEWFTGRKLNNISDYSVEDQSRIIRHGADLLESWLGKRPTWHRAGNLGANRDTLSALASESFIGDSSFAGGWEACRDIGIPARQRNAIQRIGGVLEVPITTFQDLPWIPHYRQLDVNACILDEFKTVLRQAAVHGMSRPVLIMHSFSFVQKKGGQYLPRHDEIKKFEMFLEHLEQITDVHVTALASEIPASTDMEQPQNHAYNLKTDLALTYKRAFLHRDRSLRNKLFTLLPFFFAVVLLVAIAWIVQYLLTI